VNPFHSKSLPGNKAAQWWAAFYFLFLALVALLTFSCSLWRIQRHCHLYGLFAIWQCTFVLIPDWCLEKYVHANKLSYRTCFGMTKAKKQILSLVMLIAFLT
jgi:hypothetical protein